MPDFLTPIAAVVSLIASALSNMSLNRVATLEAKMDDVIKSNEALIQSNQGLRSELTEVKALLRREKRKRDAGTGHAA